MKVLPNNLKPLHEQLSQEIEMAVQRVLRSGWYILGPEVEAFENEFASFHNTKHAVAVANGTDAIELALRANDIGPGDEVITVAHTALPTVVAIERAGAVPVPVDIDPITYTMDVEAAASAITAQTKAILPVHLYGHPADITALQQVAEKHNLLLIEDCAQAHGAQWQNRKVGTFGHVAAYSFYPTKNLGAYGDGGLVLTNDSEMAQRLTRLRNYGQESRYKHIEWGVNSRMDEIQAAILRVKLQYLEAHNMERRQLAAYYHKQLQIEGKPVEHSDAYHAYHLYVIQHPERDELRSFLQDHEIGTIIHYPIPIHLQPSHIKLGYSVGSLPITEKIANRIVSLPLYVGIKRVEQQEVIDAIHDFEAKRVK